MAHAEVFFDPQTHTGRGITFKTVFAGLHKAMQDARYQSVLGEAVLLCKSGKACSDLFCACTGRRMVRQSS